MALKSIVVMTVLLSAVLLAGGEECPVYAQGVIKIGAVQPITGPLAGPGQSVNAGLWDSLDLANEEGGINGKRIEYIMEDGQYNLEVAKKAFAKIMDQHKPPIMFGESTALGLAMAQEIKDRYKVLYCSTSFSGKLAYAAMNPYVFVSGPTYGDQVAILLKYIAKEKPKAKIAFLCSSTEMGQDPIDFGKLMCRRLGLDLVATESVGIRGDNIGSAIQVIKTHAPDYVIIHGFVGGPVPKIIKECREIGITANFAGTFWETKKEVLEGLGPLAEGYLGVNPYSFWWMTEVPGIRKIRAYNDKHHPGVIYPDTTSYTHGFLTGMVFVEVLRRADKAGNLTGDGLVSALQSLSGFDTGGISAPLTLKNNRFPAAKVWKANAAKGVFEAVSEWTDPY
jgi:branched-chain amino acid transport system substrate-binding protein